MSKPADLVFLKGRGFAEDRSFLFSHLTEKSRYGHNPEYIVP
jgi:hypothetical protein